MHRAVPVTTVAVLAAAKKSLFRTKLCTTLKSKQQQQH